MAFRHTGFTSVGMVALLALCTPMGHAAADPGGRTPPTAPADPTVAVNGQGQVTFGWTDRSSNELGFRIVRERQTSPTAWGESVGFSVGANVTSYIDNPPPGTYRYKVRAYSIRGNSSYTAAIVIGVTAAALVPASPGAFAVANAGGGVAQLTWTDQSTNETGFEIERQPAFATGARQTIAANTTTFNDPTAGGTFAYRIRSVNGSGSSPFSLWIPQQIDPPTGGNPPPTFPALIPGPGFSAPTAQPAPVGSPTAAGYDAKAIARWDVVPYQTFTSDFNVGVVAFHINGIDRVDFSCNGGPWVAVRDMQLNPQTNVWEYTARLRAADFQQDGPVEIRAVAWATTGTPRVLDSMSLYANPGRTYNDPEFFVDPVSGNDNNPGTRQSPLHSLGWAFLKVNDTNAAGKGGVVTLLREGSYEIPSYMNSDWGVVNGQTRPVYVTNDRWITVRADSGLVRDNVLISRPTRSAARPRVKKLAFDGVSLDFSLINQFYVDDGSMSWFNRCRWFQSGGRSAEYPDQTVPVRNIDYAGLYITESLAEDTVYAHVGANLVRGSACRRISGDVWQNSTAVINCTVDDLDGNATPDHHADVLQYFGQFENMVIYNVRATRVHQSQNIFMDHYLSSFKDVAFVNVLVNNVEAGQIPAAPFSQLNSAHTHVLFENVTLLGQTLIFVDTGSPPQQFVARDVVFNNCVFDMVSRGTYGQTGLPSGVSMKACHYAWGTQYGGQLRGTNATSGMVTYTTGPTGFTYTGPGAGSLVGNGVPMPGWTVPGVGDPPNRGAFPLGTLSP